MSEIDYDKFKLSLENLQEMYCFYLTQKDDDGLIVEALKESCIQRFEICFNISHAYIRKYLLQEMGVKNVLDAPKALFRQAFTANVIDDAEIWLVFTDARNATSHIYSEEKAAEVFAQIPDFIREAIMLYETMTGDTWQK